MVTRKVLPLLVALSLLVVAVAPAVAGQASIKPAPVTLCGVVVFSSIELPHYELEVNCGGHIETYVLAGNFNFSKYVGRTVIVTGYYSDKDFNIWNKPIIKVRSIKPVTFKN